jgi:tRNA threonylcarbamoyladenosine biosynthesis protein TsaE
LAKKILLKRKYLTKSPAQTKRVGAILAKKILSPVFEKGWGIPRQTALVIGLAGDLGGGKTTFLQGLAKGLGIKAKILSPTFIIMRKSEIRDPKPETNFKFENSKFKTFYHIDCYRIKKAKEILALGFKKIISNPRNIVAIEWADRIRRILPRDAMILKFELANKKTRKITVKHRG